MTRENVRREFRDGCGNTECGERGCYNVDAMVNEIMRLRAEMEHDRAIASMIEAGLRREVGLLQMENATQRAYNNTLMDDTVTLRTVQEENERLRAMVHDERLRGQQHNCQREPSYPAHETVVMPLSQPEMTAHLPTERCKTEYPHNTSECGEWRQRETAIFGDDDLPCPFCGEEAECYELAGFLVVACDNDGCGMKPLSTADTEEDAWAKWNRRTPRRVLWKRTPPLAAEPT